MNKQWNQIAIAVGAAILCLAGLASNTSGQCVSCNSDSLDAGCSDIGPWDRDFFGCCNSSFGENQVCDPCCGGLTYFSAFGGLSTVENLYRSIELPPPGSGVIENQGVDALEGFAGGSAIGYRLHPHFRAEAEYTFRSNESGDWFTSVVDNGTVTMLTLDTAVGKIRSHSGMVNFILDASRPRVGCVNLYGGGGLGLLYVDSTITNSASTYAISDGAFAWQLIGGASKPLTQQLDIFAEYRYLGADDLQVTDTATGNPFGDFDYDSHNVFIGIRFYR